MLLLIDDGNHEPIECEAGIYSALAKMGDVDEMRAFMSRYRILPHYNASFPDSVRDKSVGICTDPAELTAIKGVLETCTRLNGTARGLYRSDSPEHVEGIEEHGNTLYLHVNLYKSYWYKRFLHESLHGCDYVIGDSMLGPVSNIDLCDEPGIIHPLHGSLDLEEFCDRAELETIGETASLDKKNLRKSDVMQSAYDIAKRDSGSFKFIPLSNENTLGRAFERAYLTDSGYKDSQGRRRAFADPSYHADCFRYDLPEREQDECGYDCVFWTDNELIIKGWAQDKAESCGQIAHALLLMHVYSVYMHFDFDTGCTITAPIGLQALWFDYMLMIANQEIIICEDCGKPIIETRKPHRDKRRFCSDLCRVRNNRRKQKAKNQEIARLTGRGDNR